MTRSPIRVAVAVVMVLAGTRWVIDTNPWSGPTVVRFTETHGLHVNDWVTIVLWSGAAMTLAPVRQARAARVDRSG